MLVAEDLGEGNRSRLHIGNVGELVIQREEAPGGDGVSAASWSMAQRWSRFDVQAQGESSARRREKIPPGSGLRSNPQSA